MNRRWVAAGLLAASMSLSGGPSGISDPIPGGMRGASVPHEVVMLRMHQLNPQLSPAQRLRIWKAVERFSAKYDLERELVLAVIEVESGVRVAARSPKGALGLMQVMPQMAARMDLAGSHTTIEGNVEAGCLILANNIERLGENDGISAYFWGSEIRSVSYLNRVRATRILYRRLLDS